MNKVITINLNGIAYQLEEAGFEALRVYLDRAAASMTGNPDKEEIIADIEQAIADKFRVLLGNNKNVVTAKEVESVIKEMGPVEAEASPAGSANSANTSSTETKSSGNTDDKAKGPAAGATKPRTRRLYRLEEGAMIFGICSGLEAFTGVTVIAFRILFLVLTVSTGGLAALAYVALYFLVPRADTADERAEAQGPSPTTADFVKRAKDGYYEAMKNLPDKEARREWKRRFKDDMRKFQRSASWEARHNWNEYCTKRGWAFVPPNPFVLLICGVLNVIFFIIGLYGIYSLAVHHAAYGLAIPANMPLWIAILLFIVFLSLLSVPVKIMEKMFGGGWGCQRRHTGFGGTLLFAAVALGLAFWIYPDKTREFIDHIPAAVHQTVDSFQEWWNKR
jgi:phage shock protein PspC (stress-responsive transcriptional regulator)